MYKYPSAVGNAMQTTLSQLQKSDKQIAINEKEEFDSEIIKLASEIMTLPQSEQRINIKLLKRSMPPY